MTTKQMNRAVDASLHLTIATWAVWCVMGGLIVTTGWRY